MCRQPKSFVLMGCFTFFWAMGLCSKGTDYTISYFRSHYENCPGPTTIITSVQLILVTNKGAEIPIDQSSITTQGHIVFSTNPGWLKNSLFIIILSPNREKLIKYRINGSKNSFSFEFIECLDGYRTGGISNNKAIVLKTSPSINSRDLNMQINKIKEDVKKINSNNKYINTKLSALGNDINNANGRISNLENQRLPSQSQDFEKLSKELTNLKLDINSLQSQLNALKIDFERKIDNLRNDINKLKEKRSPAVAAPSKTSSSDEPANISINPPPLLELDKVKQKNLAKEISRKKKTIEVRFKGKNLSIFDTGDYKFIKDSTEYIFTFKLVQTSNSNTPFNLGNPEDDIKRYSHINPEKIKMEGPLTPIIMQKDYYIGAFEIYNKQYKLFNPKHPKNDLVPVTPISWQDAMSYCQRLSQFLGVTVRLPYEHEWEFAAKGQKNEVYGIDASNMDKIIYNQAAPEPVTTDRNFLKSWSQAYHMSGNVAEWTLNPYFEYPGVGKSQTEFEKYLKELKGDKYVARGGSYASTLNDCRATARWDLPPNIAQPGTGFRVVIEIPE